MFEQQDLTQMSIAVMASHARGQAMGPRLLAAAESQASEAGVRTLYLLTTSAAPFFASRGYVTLARDAAPEGIRGRAQFAWLCPASAFMGEALTSTAESALRAAGRQLRTVVLATSVTG